MPSCTQAAANMKSAMDETADPCEDFYTYSCGGWIKKPGNSRRNDFDKVKEQNKKVLRTALERNDDQMNSRFEETALKWYRSCMNNTRINELHGGAFDDEKLWRICVGEIISDFNFAAAVLFVRELNINGADVRREVMSMFNRVRDAWKSNLRVLDWLDEETREAVIKKADATEALIGYLDKFLGKDNVEQIMNTRRKNRNAAHLKSAVFGVMKMVNNVTQEPFDVDARYYDQLNKIYISAGFLGPPFYDTQTLRVLNFAGIGTILGHELTHAFDYGRQYDGGRKVRPWWSSQTIKRFENRTACLVNQYFTFKVDGYKTLRENIADNGGVKAAFRAYEAWAKEQPAEPLLPGLSSLTPQQLFFVASAQTLCATGNQVPNDSYAPGRVRVLGTLTNMKDFSRVFKCREGSRMNPSDKCEVW